MVFSDAAARIQTEIQGNILESYGVEYGYVRHLVVTIGHPARARAVLKAMLDPAPGTLRITTGASYGGSCLNVGITFLGLRALGVPERSLDTFPPEFRQGMAARAVRLGDVGTSSPETWEGGLGRAGSVHLIFTIHAKDVASLEALWEQVVVAGSDGAYRELSRFDGETLVDPATGKRVEHFGFRDGISQPRFEGVGRRPRAPKEPVEPLGIVLLGYPTSYNVAMPVPGPAELGHQGSFNAFRVLAQDVAGFRDYVADVATATGVSEELVMAKVCGRWRNGVPVGAADTFEQAEEFLASGAELNDFDFTDDQDGRACPLGSHIRRTYPRRAQIVQRPANRTRRLVRRGVPFGPWLDPGARPASIRERGLLGSFLCASLSTQFEAMQYDWMNLGLLHPSITGTNDPLVGANDPAVSSFSFSTEQTGWQTVRKLPEFVQTMGGAYCFLPSLRAIDWIASHG
ncbi:MAG: Dyp-type peroxidase [Acidimicrobiales bacterium]